MNWKNIAITTFLVISFALTSTCMAQKIGVGGKTAVYPIEDAFQSFELFSSIKFMRTVKKTGPEGEEQIVYKDFASVEAGVWVPEFETLKFETLELSSKFFLLFCPVCPCKLYTGAGAYMELDQLWEKLGFTGFLGIEIEVMPPIFLLSEFRINTEQVTGIPAGPTVTVGTKVEL